MKISSYAISLYLRIWAGLFGGLGLVVVLFFGFSVELLLTALGCLVLAVPIFLLVTMTGDTLVNLFYFGSRSQLTLEQQLIPELDKVRNMYRLGQYSRAMALIRQILDEAPGHPEALIWKARLVLTKDGDHLQAKSILQRVVRETAADDPNHRWAAALVEELAAAKPEAPTT